MNCLFWNIRGIGKGEKGWSIRNLVDKKKIIFMGLVETKHRNSLQNRMKRMWGNEEFEIYEVFASDTNGGGVIAVWDTNTFNASIKHTGNRWILIEGTIIEHNFDCCVGVIYGHNDRVRRYTLFEEVRQKLESISKPTLLLGDFNVTLHAWERIGTFTCDRSMREFSEWIADLNLIDIPLHGVKFTWRRNNSQSKLDRGLCSQSWITKFSNMNLMGLNRSTSDHNPLLLTLVPHENWGPKPFRCYDAWFMNPHFKAFLSNECRSIPDVPLHNKMKIIKTPLKSWRRENFDVIDKKIADLEVVIHDLERKGEDRVLDSVEMARLKAASSILHQWLIRRERVWRQKARTYGFNIKDHNMKFFHASTIFKRKKNEISQVIIDGRRVAGVANLKEGIRNHFRHRFAQDQIPGFDFDLKNHPKVSSEQVLLLEATPSREEIKKAVWACGIDKAPGFDGFNFKFIREMWEVLEDEIYESVLEFFISGHSVRHLNVTWVTLIPKRENPTDIDDYRPISMVGALYKIIAKILSTRLKVVIDTLIDESQSAFVMNRQILDGVLIANEPDPSG